jgi:hypothetical protein
MTNLKKLKVVLYAGILLVFSFSLFSPISCKNTTSPENEISEIKITVINECGVAVDIYVDKNFQFTVEYLESKTIRNLSLGDYEFEAKKKGTEIQLAFLSVELTEIVDFVWTLQSEASFHATNEYGETLNIYGDGDLLSDIGSPATLIIENVLYGVHLFEAKKVSDETTVASISIDFAENTAYFWTINK